MGPDAEESLAHDDERRYVEDEIWGQIMKVQPVIEHEAADKWMEGKPQSADALLGKSLAAARVLGLLAARGPALLIRRYS